MNNNFSRMEKERKVALIVLGIFSVVILTALFWNLSSSIKNPVSAKKMVLKTDESKKTCTDGSCAVSGDSLSADNIELKNKDTDKDGLSNWDELFIYGTSPYLEDTDGDGLSDSEEINVYKTNPTCPEGQVCSGTLTQGDAQENVSVGDDISGLYDLLNSLEESDTSTNTSTTSNNPTSSSSNLNIDPAQLRSLLLENGFSKEDLDAISDADLLKIYQEATTEL